MRPDYPSKYFDDKGNCYECMMSALAQQATATPNISRHAIYIPPTNGGND